MVSGSWQKACSRQRELRVPLNVYVKFWYFGRNHLCEPKRCFFQKRSYFGILGSYKFIFLIAETACSRHQKLTPRVTRPVSCEPLNSLTAQPVNAKFTSQSRRQLSPRSMFELYRCRTNDRNISARNLDRLPRHA